jgi:hypothetical protein
MLPASLLQKRRRRGSSIESVGSLLRAVRATTTGSWIVRIREKSQCRAPWTNVGGHSPELPLAYHSPHESPGSRIAAVENRNLQRAEAFRGKARLRANAFLLEVRVRLRRAFKSSE